ncbi:glycosyltransferase family 4 protein [Candidatus Latescibacterota bacterium]
MAHYIQAASIRWYNACAYYAVALSQGLAALGHRVTFAGTSGTPAVKKAGEIGIEILDGSSRKANTVLNQIRLIRRYRLFALNNDVTLVNVHNGGDHFFWAMALRGTGIPLIRTSGNQIPPNVHPLSRYLMKKGTKGVIATCKTIRGFYTEGFGIDADTIPVINGGIDVNYYTTEYKRNLLRKKFGLPEKGFVFGIVGRFSPDKGHIHFFRAAGMLAKDYPDIRFHVAGWNAQLKLEDIHAMAKEAGIFERTVFSGREKDSRDIVGSLDAGIIASVRSETVCRIAIEYMAMGIPVIASDTNVIPEIIRNNESGLIIPAGNPVAMAETMKRLLTSKGLAETLGQSGRKIAEKEYSLESFASKTIKAYRSILGNGN